MLYTFENFCISVFDTFGLVLGAGMLSFAFAFMLAAILGSLFSLGSGPIVYGFSVGIGTGIGSIIGIGSAKLFA